MASSRVDNVLKNVSLGVAGRLLNTLLAFVGRSVFIYVLGMEYLGISGLFTNVLRVLSIADLGLSTAIIFSMYKPIAENDIQKLTALTSYYQKLFRVIAAAVLVLGLALIPFLPYVIQLEEEIPHLTLYYVITLLDSVVSYLFVYKTSITIANQREYQLTKYGMVMSVVKCVGQIAVLLLFHAYVLYLVVQVLCTLLTNVLKARKSEKLFPYIREKAQLPKAERKQLFGHAWSAFMVNVSGIMLTQTDNLLISAMVSTALVGFYANYLLIIDGINQLTGILSTALTASVGNLSAIEGAEKKRSTFETMDFAFWWFHGFCAVTFWMLAPDFFGLWGAVVGENLQLGNWTVLVIVLNCYMYGVRQPLAIFRNTTGLFNNTRFMYVAAAVLNLALSVALGRVWGITGILLATAIANILTVTWYMPKVLYRLQFNTSMLPYWRKHLVYLLATLGCGVGLQLAFSFLHVGYIAGLLARGAACVLVVNGAFFLLFRKTREFGQLAGILRGWLQKLRKK